MSVDWRTQLPTVAGRLQFDAPLANQVWFRVGGPADVLYRPKDVADLCLFLQQRPEGVPITILGAASNVLIRDGGISGIVIRLSGGFAEITRDGDCLEVGAGALDRTVALYAAEQGLQGLEFLVGVPGTIGGAVKMNAGCYGRELKDVLEWADVIDFNGNLSRLTPADLKFDYRQSSLTPDQIVIKVRLKGLPGVVAEIQERLKKLLCEREESQPVKGRTGGSTFRNPSPQSAWQLIDAAGCRGLTIGDAQVSDKHCNFLLNLGTASAADIETLGETVRERVLQQSGVSLHWEIVRLGKPGC